MGNNFQHPVDFEEVPQGNYGLQVFHVLTIRPPKGGLYTNIYWKVLYGPHAGKTTHTFFTRNTEGGEKAFRRAKDAMGLNPDKPCTDDELLGRQCLVTLEIGPHGGNSATWFAPLPKK